MIDSDWRKLADVSLAILARWRCLQLKYGKDRVYLMNGVAPFRVHCSYRILFVFSLDCNCNVRSTPYSLQQLYCFYRNYLVIQFEYE